jgi:hypothetical protein
LSLAGGSFGAGVGPPGDTLTANTAVTLHEEEISDVSLSTFYAFDRENAGARRPGLRLAQRSAVDRGKVARAQKTAQAEAPHAALAAQATAIRTAMRLQDEAGDRGEYRQAAGAIEPPSDVGSAMRRGGLLRIC